MGYVPYETLRCMNRIRLASLTDQYAFIICATVWCQTPNSEK